MEPVEYPIDGVLDLHAFDPSDASDIVWEYVRACREEGITELRIIHGKGTGQLRQLVHRTLDKIDCVEKYQLAGDRSSWGATLVVLNRS